MGIVAPEAKRRQPKNEPYNRKKWPVIYALRHEGTGKIYVGYSADIADRIYNHRQALKRGVHSIEALQYDYDHFGHSLSFCILAECASGSPWAIKQMERLYMSFLGTRNPKIGYNSKDPSNAFDLESQQFYPIPEESTRKELDPRVTNNRLPAQYNTKNAHSAFYHARIKAGYFGTEVAAALGVDRKTVNRWDRGIGWPNGNQIIAAAKLFGIEPSELLREETA